MSTYTPSPTRWRALAVLAAAQFLIIMDTSIIGVALPDMQQSLGFGGLLLVGGKLSDIFGARRIFTAGFWILTVASLAAGLANTPTLEIVARAAQGVGAALIAPSALPERA